MLQIARSEVVREPFPHVIRQPFLAPELFTRLRDEYPADAVFERTSPLNARAGRDLYRGDALFDGFIAASPAWREFYKWANSPAYVQLVLDLFGEDMLRLGCKVDPRKAHFTDYVEPREALVEEKGLRGVASRVRSTLGGGEDPNELFVRFDLGQARVGYEKRIHCDLPNRITTMVMYFSDADEAGLEGGDLRVHEHLEKRQPSAYERYPHEDRTRVVATLRPRKNLGVLLLCCNNSYHSVTPITAGRGHRNWTYFSVSSRAARIW